MMKTVWEKEIKCFLLKQIIVSPFVFTFDIISLFSAEFEEPKTVYQLKVNPYLISKLLWWRYSIWNILWGWGKGWGGLTGSSPLIDRRLVILPKTV